MRVTITYSCQAAHSLYLRNCNSAPREDSSASRWMEGAAVPLNTYSGRALANPRGAG